MEKTKTIFVTLLAISLLIILVKYSLGNQSDRLKYRYRGKIVKPTICPENLPQFSKSFDIKKIGKFNDLISEDVEHQILANAISKNPVKEVLVVNKNARNINHHFSNKISNKTKITDQKYSGRCWIFAFLNMFRYRIIREFSLPNNFEFSQTYFCFFDKLEKCYYFLQNIAISSQESINERKIDWMLKSCLSDGGNWNMLVNLINKYGIVPKNAMPETYSSSNTSSLNMFLKQNIRRMAYAIRAGKTEGKSVKEYIDNQILFIYKILVIFLGEPPSTFKWDYINQRTDKLVVIDNLNPYSFSEKYVRFNSNDWVVLGNYPIEGYPFYQSYNIKYCNNMLDGQETQIFNVPINDMLNLVRKPLDNNQPVWIAVDWGKYHSCEHGSLDVDLYDYKRLGYYPMDKGVSLEYRLTVPNHAVLLVGYNIDKDGNIDKWLIENSHGDDTCKLGKKYKVDKLGKGYYTMTTDWFRNFVFQVVIETKYLSSEMNTYLNREPIYIEPWGAIGCELLKVTGQ